MIKSSGLLTSGANVVYTGYCRLRGVSFSAAVTASPTVTVTDSATTGGTALAYGMAAGGTAAEGGATNFVIRFSKEDNLICDVGILATLSGTGSCIVYYEIL